MTKLDKLLERVDCALESDLGTQATLAAIIRAMVNALQEEGDPDFALFRAEQIAGGTDEP